MIVVRRLSAGVYSVVNDRPVREHEVQSRATWRAFCRQSAAEVLEAARKRRFATGMGLARKEDLLQEVRTAVPQLPLSGRTMGKLRKQPPPPAFAVVGAHCLALSVHASFAVTVADS